MEVSEASIIEMMKLSAELGIELYVMDDGWFGNGDQARVTDHAGLGDWQPNKARFPNGLAPLLTMLNACAPGVGVVNIDNGYGGGHLAAQIAAPRG